MQQMDLFDETLAKKIVRMERWCARLQKEIWFLKEVYNMTQLRSRMDKAINYVEQDMFKEYNENASSM